MKKTTNNPKRVIKIITQELNKVDIPYTSITSIFNPKTRLYEVVMR